LTTIFKIFKSSHQTVIAHSIAISLFILFAIHIESSGVFFPSVAADGQFQVIYRKDSLIKTARTVNIFAYFWFTAFIFGCQQYIVSGAISSRYYDGHDSRSPILGAFKKLLAIHLGTVSLWSIFFHFVKIARIVGDKTCMMCFRRCIPKVFSLKYLIGHVIIRAARDGSSYFQAGQRVYKDFSCSHNENAVALKEFMEVLMTVGRQSVVMISCVAGYFLMVKYDNFQIIL
jgi:hypothetical protein